MLIPKTYNKKFSTYKFDTFYCECDKDEFAIGEVLYLKLDSESKPIFCSTKESSNSIPYCVKGFAINTTPPVTSLINLDFYIQGRLTNYCKQLGDRVTYQDLVRVVDRVNQTIEIDKLYITETYRNTFLYKIDSVLKRIDHCRELISDEAMISHRNTPLIIYLLLTCFDNLGQPDNWLSFGSWIKAKKEPYLTERNKITKEYELSEKLISLTEYMYESYNKIYSARTSFHNFMEEVLLEDSKNRLFDSIEIRERSLKPERKYLRSFSNKEKAQFLYKLRNDFTHKAQFIPNNYVFGRREGLNEKITFQEIVKKDKEITVSFTNWPYILEDIVIDGLGTLIKNYLK